MSDKSNKKEEEATTKAEIQSNKFTPNVAHSTIQKPALEPLTYEDSAAPSMLKYVSLILVGFSMLLSDVRVVPSVLAVNKDDVVYKKGLLPPKILLPVKVVVLLPGNLPNETQEQLGVLQSTLVSL